MISLSGTPSCTKLLTYCLTLLLLLLLVSFVFNSQFHHTSVVKIPHTARSTPLVLYKQQSNSLSKFVSSGVIQRSLDWKRSCLFHTCFNISHCTLKANDRVSVYVYPKMHYNYKFTFSSNQTLVYDPPMSWEYEEIINTVINSEYYEPNASQACMFIPYLDLLNQRTVNTSISSAIFQALKFWNNGQNHVIFSMLSGTYPHFNSTPDVLYDCAVIAGGSLHSTTYRRGFDVAIPVYNSLTYASKYRYTAVNSPRHNFLTVLTQPGSDSAMVAMLIKLASDEKSAKHNWKIISYCLENPSPGVRCTVGQKRIRQDYPVVLQSSVFCLMVPGFRLGTPDLLDAMMTGCIPVLVKTGHVLPFSEVLDWSRAVVMIWEEELPTLMATLTAISERVQEQMRDHIIYLYWRFFSSISSIVLTTLDILNSRIYPLSSHNSYEWWNNQPFNPSNTKYFQYSYPYGLDLPAPPPNQGFTAVIYSSHDNIQNLFSTVQSVAKAPSLTQLVVLWWSSADQPPPPALVEETLPNINKPIRVISMESDKLSNRFYPYKDIKTAAILSLDDDVSILTVDEIEFGYKAWQENPKQLVGYTGRTHWYDEYKMQWYSSNDSGNNISMVLIGAAFYHSFYNYQYTHHLTPNIRHYIDEHVYCMDIGFNFMMANFTGLSPIKITPRKHFPCTSCQHKTVGSQYYNLRDQCLNQLAKLFYNMPLKTTSYRLDPVLYKVDAVKEQFKSYANMAEL